MPPRRSPLRRPSPSFARLLLSLLLPPLAAQDAPQLDGPAIVARLRGADVTATEAAAFVPQLASSPIALRLQAIDAIGAQCRERTKKLRKAAEQTMKDAAKAAARVHKELLGKQGPAKVDTLRDKRRALTQADPLTKEKIHEEIDPVVDELTALQWPTPERLLAADPSLQQALDAQRAERDEIGKWTALWAEAATGLEMHPDAQKHFKKSPQPAPPPTAAALDDELVVWTLLGVVASGRDRKVLEDNEALRPTSDPQEFAGTTALNRLRWLLGLSLLRIDPRLGQAARDHSEDMKNLGFFAHESPVPGKRTPSDRASRFGTSGGAENIAQGHDTGPSAIRGWWYSPGHHRNMLGGHGRTGLGRADQLWTQMFGS